ncbi:MAG: chromosome segregation protein SMC [Candidatus Omnitrophota bacterium]|nr:chromosome segregation protein SMC [Candidatus Omnitrophota bacterium]
MRVKRLELFGFKSFAHKTTIHFEPGVTAIVGPNGSGKSNLVDSIRWVLGEHNPRDVRAPRLEDVIFNGTDRRAPLSMAEVQLTIANEQGLLPVSFTEVSIARRVYRSGESECFINQSPCRLRDIQELLLGTGLGGGAYAIIEQGHIDMILSSKPEERRLPFEEASGVAKYLAKRQETMRRLDDVEGHLVRIADIIGEVRRQLGALERAAQKARRYKSQWEQLKQLELQLAMDELHTGQTRRAELERQLQALQAQREEQDAQKQRHVAAFEAGKAAASTLQQQVHTLRTTVVECASRIDQHESQSTLKTRWIEELTTQMRRIEEESAQLGARLAQVEEQRVRMEGGIAELQAQVAAARQQETQQAGELAALEQDFHGTADAVAAAKATLFEAASEASHQRNELARASSRLQALDAQVARVEGQRTQQAARAEEMRHHREASLQERGALQAQRETIQQHLVSLDETLRAAEATRHELSGRVHQLHEQLARERAQVALLEDLWKHYEGFPEAVKMLIAQSIDGLLGPLVDLVQAAPGYEEVVEAALGPLAEALVVRDRAALGQCRAALQAQQLGGCRFLVLSDCPQMAGVAVAPPPDAGVAGAVKGYVQTDPSYQPLIDWLLDDSWLVEDIQRWLDGHPMPQSRLVSAWGDRWDRRSWRFGGARSGMSSRLGRRQRWEHAKAGLQALDQERARLDAEAAQAEEAWRSLISEQESEKSRLGQVMPSLHKLESSLVHLTHELERSEQERQTLTLELQELTTQQEACRSAMHATQQAAADAEERQRRFEQVLADAQAAREAAEQRRQQLVMAKAQGEATLISLGERVQALETRGQELEAERVRLTQQLDAKTTQRQEAERRAAELSQQRQAHQDDGQRLQGERARLEAELATVSQTLREEEAKRDQVLPRLLEAEQQLSSILQRIQECGQQLSEHTFRRSRLFERLQELYQVDEATLQAAQQAQQPPLTGEQRSALAEQVQKLRARLEGIGPVSLGSVEEYDALTRRLEFLQTQQRDLVQARDDLKASITQINRAARAQFRETFERIKQEFMHYFTRLFNGGQADLILVDEEDVLASGIEIVARPPGKRLQSITLLSGGERALTAIALLFALFKVRPSPFCILDEIDAPLDEANVDRFTHVLEEFLALSQFILVTHNKKTITKADSLYGVTMEEPGISKILSAKLIPANSQAAIPSPVSSPAA